MVSSIYKCYNRGKEWHAADIIILHFAADNRRKEVNMAIIGAFMVPHPPLIIGDIGRGQEMTISKTIAAYREVAKEIARLKPDTIVLTTPHSVMYSDYFHISPGNFASGDFGQFGASQVRMDVKYDSEFVNELVQLLDTNDFEGGTLGEREKNLDHATMVPLYFINQEYSDYKLVRIGLSGQSLPAHYTLGEYIKQASEQLHRKVVFIASGDLSHKLKDIGPYGYQKEGPEYDKKIMEVMGSGHFLELFDFDNDFCDKAGECGHRSFVIMAGALDRTKVISKELSYEGPFGVGYGVCSYEVTGIDDSRNFGEQYAKAADNEKDLRIANEDAYVQLARRTLETFIKSRKIISVPDGLPEEMLNRQAGTFVSIKKNGRLRGCIGTISATKDCIAEEIIQNAVSAGVHDPRFSPIKEDELSELVYSVDVLGETEPINSKDDLDVKRYGVIVTSGHRRGLLLPNLEGVDTVDEQISISKQKAGIDESEDVMLERFEVVRHH